MGMLERDFYFNVQGNRVLCRPEMFILQANGIAGFGCLNLFSLVILSEAEECVIIAIYRHGFF
jgi:hypothetical protein